MPGVFSSGKGRESDTARESGHGFSTFVINPLPGLRRQLKALLYLPNQTVPMQRRAPELPASYAGFSQLVP